MAIIKPDNNKEIEKIINAPPDSGKSKAAPPGVKTFLLYIPNELHRKIRMKAAMKEVTLHDRILAAIENDVTDIELPHEQGNG